MLPMRPILPEQASIASASMVLPAEAWPRIAKLLRSDGEYSFMNQGVDGWGSWTLEIFLRPTATGHGPAFFAGRLRQRDGRPQQADQTRVFFGRTGIKES